MGSYTTKELEHDTGFGRRTIAYYIQEGLLPRVGRRGPRTRYPELVRDRLLFIRRVREAEAEAEIAPVRLSDLRELFKALPRGLVANVAGGETPITPDIVSLSSAEQRSMVDRVSALRERLLTPPPAPAAASPAAPFPEDEALELRAEAPRVLDEHQVFGMRAMEEPDDPYPAALRSLGSPFEDDVAADAMSPPEPDENADTLGNQLEWVLRELQTQARDRHEFSPEAVDTWSQVEVTPDIRLSVRGMADEDAYLLRMAARLLRQMLEIEPVSMERSSREREE